MWSIEDHQQQTHVRLFHQEGMVDKEEAQVLLLKTLKIECGYIHSIYQYGKHEVMVQFTRIPVKFILCALNGHKYVSFKHRNLCFSFPSMLVEYRSSCPFCTLDHPPNRCSIPVDYPERFPNITLPPVEVKEGPIPVIQGSWTLIPRVVNTPLFAKEHFPSVMSPGERRSSVKGRNMQKEKGETR